MADTVKRTDQGRESAAAPTSGRPEARGDGGAGAADLEHGGTDLDELTRRDRERGDAHPLDKVEEASEESFPASDPPGWT